MANHKSADKRARQTIAKTAINKNVKSAVRTFEKKTLKALEEGNKKDAEALFKTYSSKIDRAAKNGVFHKNTASRKKSRLSLKISTAS